MARLRQIELKALSDALFALYSPGPHTDLPVRMFKALQRCLSFDLLAYHEIWNNQNQRGVSYPEYPFDYQAFDAYLHQHPTMEWSQIG